MTPRALFSHFFHLTLHGRHQGRLTHCSCKRAHWRQMNTKASRSLLRRAGVAGRTVGEQAFVAPSEPSCPDRRTEADQARQNAKRLRSANGVNSKSCRQANRTRAMHLGTLALVLLAAPFRAHAQAVEVFRIGWLGFVLPKDPDVRVLEDAFVEA